MALKKRSHFIPHNSQPLFIDFLRQCARTQRRAYNVSFIYKYLFIMTSRLSAEYFEALLFWDNTDISLAEINTGLLPWCQSQKIKILRNNNSLISFTLITLPAVGEMYLRERESRENLIYSLLHQTKHTVI